MTFSEYSRIMEIEEAKADNVMADIDYMIESANATHKLNLADLDFKFESEDYDMDAMTLNILEKATGTQFNHTAYFASSEIFTSLLGGHIDFAIANPAEVVGLVEGGRVKVLGTFSPSRLTGLFAEIPTFTEMGYPECQVQMIRGIVGPVNMSREVQQYWSEILKKVSETKEWKENYLQKNYLGETFMDCDQFTTFLESHEADLVDFAKGNGIKVVR